MHLAVFRCRRPTLAGSGGMGGSAKGGTAFVLLANASSSVVVAVWGTITVNGASAVSTVCSGGGAGGSVAISAGTLQGSGSILARGGGGGATTTTCFGGSGGGGRIAGMVHLNVQVGNLV